MRATHRLAALPFFALCAIACSGTIQGAHDAGLEPDHSDFVDSNPCLPATCAAAGKNCGDLPDGCEGTLHCGSCTDPETCGGGGIANVCGAGTCTPTTCQANGCGDMSDGCSAILHCGDCTSGTCGGGGTANACGGACAEGQVTAPCGCGGQPVATGYCCSGSWQATTCDVGPISDLVDPDRITTWKPGILADEQLNQPLGADGLPQRTTVCTTVAAGGNIQSAIDACPEGQVVQLAATTFTVSTTIELTKGVVLRGAGSGATGGTTIVKTGGGTVIAIGTDYDSACYGGTGHALTQDGAKESTTITVGAAAGGFSVGDLALIDVVDDATVDQGDCPYFKRVSGRSVSQRVEITGVDTGAGTLTLDSPLHWPFRAASPGLAQITRVTSAITRWAGVEGVRLQGGTNPGYNGQMAGGIDISNAAYCWVKDVQTDGTIGGMHVSMTGTYRCVVRDGYFHNSANYGFGADCYGIVLRCGAAENLIENNIVRWMNKPIMFNVSGGGNVVAYNYADNSWATPAAWQEVNIDCHCAFPHMELMEGNLAPHMGATTTHGNAGYLTYFRNYASSQFAPPAVWGSTDAQTGNVTALQFDGGDLGMNVIGNVLGTAGWSTVYDAYDSGPKSIYELGAGGSGATDVAATSLYRHGNFDVVTNDVVWSPASSGRTLPPSFYLTGRPAWWPTGVAWPWAGPDLTPMAGVLPAKTRSDAM
jgi:hypothetical protein